AIDDANRLIIMRTEGAQQEIGARASAIEQIFVDADKRLEDRAAQTTSNFDTRVDVLADKLVHVNEMLANSARNIASKVSDDIASAHNKLTESANATSRAVLDEIAKSEQQLNSRVDVVAETFSAVGNHITQTTNEAARTIGDNTRQLNEMLASRSSEITKILDETAKPLVDRFSEGGADLQRSIEQVTERTAERMRAENAALVEALSTRAEETIAAVQQVRSSLAGEVSDLLGRLTNSNSQLSELIDLAGRSLSNVDQKLSSTTQNFAATTEKAAQTFASSARLIDSNAGRLTDVSSRTLKEVAGIASRFEEHTKLLSGASDLLGSAQSHLVSTLDDRQSALEELAVGLVKKSEDIERTMKSFDNLVGAALEKAEDRTKHSTTQIRAAISEVIEAATQRFSDATDEIRRTAGSIRTDLEETRAELRKGVLDMPAEAKESTSAIRRAVAEQINALKELSDIVAKTGRTVDIPDDPQIQRPAPQPQQRSAPQSPQRPAP
ncbi:MAG: kinesin, partial [Rhizobiaceae bacterium]|nr:kinesin [Rhizobiaceae bacterium]